MDKPYRLQYLPLFEQDLAAARDYIAINLQNPTAALQLLEDVDKAIKKRFSSPDGFAPYPRKRAGRYPYYRINIRKYSVFYVLIDNIMEVRRFVYGKRDIDKLI